jgi:hypothetical protein
VAAINKRLIPPLVGTGISTLLLCAVGIEGTGRFGLDPRNIALANQLSSCSSREIVGGDVRVGYTLDGNIVFDVRSCKGNCRLIDPLHLLLQFGYKVRDDRFGHLAISAGGQEVYRLAKSDVDELAREYELGGRIWAFNQWPERLRKPTGERAFGTWSGGLLGVIKGQIEDMTEAIKTWLSKVMTS